MNYIPKKRIVFRRQPRVGTKVICPTCNTSFVLSRKDRVFCSNRCKCKTHRESIKVCNQNISLLSNYFLKRAHVVFSSLLGNDLVSCKVHKSVLFRLNVCLDYYNDECQKDGIAFYIIGAFSFTIDSKGFVLIQRNVDQEAHNLIPDWIISRWRLVFDFDEGIDGARKLKLRNLEKVKLVT